MRNVIKPDSSGTYSKYRMVGMENNRNKEPNKKKNGEEKTLMKLNNVIKANLIIVV